MRGRGYEVLGVRELTAEDVKGLRRAKPPAVKTLRAIHRRICLLLAAGHSQTRVAEITGYSLHRVWILSQDPAVKEYIANLEGQILARDVDELSEANAKMVGVNNMSWQLIYDRMERAIDEGTEDEIPWAVLLKAAGDAADRVGLAKRSVAVNVNVDFASQLNKAVQRSRLKVINGAPAAPTAEVPVEGRDGPLIPGSPRPIPIHEVPHLVKPAGVGSASSSHPTRPLLVNRRTA